MPAKNTAAIMANIKERLITLEYKPGQPLNEKELADEFGVSRTPIHEICKILEKDGWLEIIPRVGIFVKPIDFKFVRDAFEMRYAIDVINAEYMMERATESDIKELFDITEQIQIGIETGDIEKRFDSDTLFFQKLLSMNSNELMRTTYQYLTDHLYRVWNYCWESIRPQYIMEVGTNCLEIAEAISRHDMEACRAHMKNYMSSTKKLMKDMFF